MGGVSFIDEREDNHDSIEEVREKKVWWKEGKEKVVLILAGVILGVVVMYSFGEYVDKRLPPAIEIERGGKVVGYADTSEKTSEFIFSKNAKSPGMFLAFPIFGDQREILKSLQVTNGTRD